MLLTSSNKKVKSFGILVARKRETRTLLFLSPRKLRLYWYGFLYGNWRLLLLLFGLQKLLVIRGRFCRSYVLQHLIEIRFVLVYCQRTCWNLNKILVYFDFLFCKLSLLVFFRCSWQYFFARIVVCLDFLSHGRYCRLVITDAFEF